MAIIPFRISREIMRTLGYTLPSFALILYLLELKGDSGLVTRKPQTRDFLSLIIALPGLLGIGLGISAISPLFSTTSAAMMVESPKGLLPWFIMFLASLGTGYLEETFFRHYLLTRFRKGGIHIVLRITLSVFLFSLCHLYEGFWGTLNAVLAGLFLALIYTRYSTLHGLAWAHGLYNAFVYTTGI